MSQTRSPQQIEALKKKFAQHLAPAEQIVYRRALIYGPSRAGKTTFLGSAAYDPRTAPHLICDFGGGTGSLYGIPDNLLQVITIRDWQDFNDVYGYLETGESKYKSVSIDSLTDTHLYALFGIVDSEIANNRNRKQDDLEIHQSDYGKAMVQMRRLLMSMKTLPMHTFFTALSKTEVEPREGSVRKPFLFGQMSEEVVGMFDITGFLSTTRKKDGDEKSDTQRVLVLQNYPGLRVGIRTPFGETIPNEVVLGSNDGVTKLFDLLKIPKEGTLSKSK